MTTEERMQKLRDLAKAEDEAQTELKYAVGVLTMMVVQLAGTLGKAKDPVILLCLGALRNEPGMRATFQAMLENFQTSGAEASSVATLRADLDTMRQGKVPS